MAAAVLPMASSIHPAVSVLSSVGIRRGVMVLVLRAILVLGLLVRLALILVLGCPWPLSPYTCCLPAGPSLSGSQPPADRSELF